MPTYFEDRHIGEILQATDIVALVSTYMALKPQGKDFVGLCPFHNDRRPSMFVSPGKQIFKCFSCGAGGDVIKFIMLKERMTFPEAVKYLAEQANIVLPERDTNRSSSPGREYDRNSLELVNRWAAKFYRSEYDKVDEGRIARDYVENRGISESTSRKFGLGWAPKGWDLLIKAAKADNIDLKALSKLGLVIEKDSGGYYDRFRERLMFPVLDGLKRVIAFGGRTLANDPAKYMNSPESDLFDKSRNLFGLHAAKDAIVTEKTAIVVEGYTDCIMAHQEGVCNVVATLGTAMTKEHARMLSRYAQKIILMFDSDQAGMKASDRAIELFFGQNVEVELVSLPDGQDPCDFLLANGGQAFTAELGKSVNAMDYKWAALLRNYEKTDGINGRGKAIEEFLKLTSQMSRHGNIDPIREGLIVNKVAGLLNQQPNIIHRQLASMRNSQPASQQLNSELKHSKLSFGTLDAVNRSYLNILEVLLNEPGFYGMVKEQTSDLSGLSHPVLRQVYERIKQCCEQMESPSLGAILGGCESIELCNIITDLSHTGEMRGNYEKTLEGAFSSLAMRNEKVEREKLKEMITDSANSFDRDTLDVMLADLQARLIKHKTE